MQFTPSNFIANLSYMGIFVVIGIIILVTIALGKVTNRKSGKEA